MTQSIVKGMENVLGCDLDGDGTKGAGYGLIDGLEAVSVTVSVNSEGYTGLPLEVPKLPIQAALLAVKASSRLTRVDVLALSQ